MERPWAFDVSEMKYFRSTAELKVSPWMEREPYWTKHSRLSTLQTDWNPSTFRSFFSRQLRRHGRNTKALDENEMKSASFLQFFAFAIIELLKSRNGAPDTEVSFGHRTMYFHTYDLAPQGIIDIQIVSSVQIRIIFFDYLLLDTLLWCKTKKQSRLVYANCP